MSSTDENQAYINYYLKRKWFHHVASYCEVKLKICLADPYLILWRSASLLLAGDPTACLQELEAVAEKRDFALVYLLVAKDAHNRCKYINEDAIQTLDAKLTITNSTANLSDTAYGLAGAYSWHAGDLRNAEKYFKIALSKNSSCFIALMGLGWMDLESGIVTESFHYALEISAKNLEAMLGQSHVLRLQRKSGKAMDLLFQIIAYFPSFIPSYIERMSVFFENLNWPALLEASQRLGGMEHGNIDSLLMTTWYEMCCEGVSSSSTSYLNTVRLSISNLEPNNARLLFKVAQSFSRLAQRDKAILHECEAMLQRALELSPEISEYYVEMGRISYLLGDLPHSKAAYEKSTSLDPGNLPAIEGVIQYLITTGQYEAADQQLEMLNELQRGQNKSAELCYMNALVQLRFKGNHQSWLAHLKDALQIKLSAVSSQTISLDYYIKFDPEFIISVIESFMDVSRDGQLSEEETTSFNYILRDILEITLRILPGSAESLYLMAKTEVALGDYQNGELHLQKSISKNKGAIKPYILLAEVLLARKDYSESLSALEMALSFDFSIRQNVQFLYLKARCLNLKGEWGKALATLKSALALSSTKEALKALENKDKWSKSPSSAQIAEIFVELIASQSSLGNQDDALETLKKCLEIFQSTPLESLFMISNAKFLVDRGDIKRALDILSAVRPVQAGYLEARTLMGDIYLNILKDKKKYTSCFKDVVEMRPTIETSIMLGEAFLKIQEPLEAIEVYRKCQQRYPQEILFASKIGEAYIMMHDYQRAISYYLEAIEADKTNPTLIFNLANLHFDLQDVIQAHNLINQLLETSESSEKKTLLDVNIFKLNGDILLSLFEVERSLNSFINAKNLLSQLSAGATGKEASKINEELESVCIKLGNISLTELKQMDKAEAYFSEALTYSPDSTEASLCLIKAYIAQSNHSAAQVQLGVLLEKNPDCAEASLLSATIHCEKNSFQAALFHYAQLLEKNPVNFEALADLIGISNRLSSLGDTEVYLEKAKAFSRKSSINPGFHYCRGLYLRLRNRIDEAMKEFVVCRKDPIWGERASHQLIEIFLNPGDEAVGGEALASAKDTSASNTNLNDEGDLHGVLTADKLIEDLPQDPKSFHTRTLEGLALVCCKQKDDIERGIVDILEILKVNPDFVPALYASSVGFILLKQMPRARNQLKRVTKFEWSKEHGDYLEKCWILLADLYIQSGKYDLATDLLKKVIAVNLSSSKAFEYLGYIMEKEQSYTDAAEYYYRCWKLQSQFNSSIGYKLAYNYLKAKRYMDAIDICHQVLQATPNYPKIKTEILDKARKNLRFL